MKKKNVLLLALVALFVGLFTLTGCTEEKKEEAAKIPADSPYIGTWDVVKVQYKDVEDEASAVFEEGNKFEIVLNADGSAKIIGKEDASEESTNNTWEITDKGIKIKGDSKLTLKKDGDNLIYKMFGVTFYFEKQA